MAGQGFAPKDARRGRAPLRRGEWKAASGIGWQHGRVPKPPEGLTDESRDAWRVWFGSWFAAHWTPGDLPGLRIVIGLYDQVQLGRFQRASELRLWSDSFGLTPKGAADRRWRAPEPMGPTLLAPTPSPYAHLRAIRTGDEDAPA